MSAERARELAREEYGRTETVIDVPTSFDGTWCNRGWTASNGVVSAIADTSSQHLSHGFANNATR